ncbi:MAG: hydroxyacid dehydrogenase [Deltaproteobacteria bacterium]|nr:hydroxyacid dehydrogenase [Deltaproteobacteria bacterium]
MNFRVLVSDKLDKQGVDLLANAAGITVDVKTGLKPEEQLEIIGNYDGLVVRSATKVTEAMLAKAKNLKIVIRAGIGVDNINLAACKAAGVVVENTPRGNVVSAAEHAIALMMSLARQVPSASHLTKSGVWEKSKYMGTEITGKTLGIVGTGNIGAVVVDRAIGLRMKVIAFDPILTAEKAAALGVEKLTHIDELWPRADVISLHVPLIESTKNILNDLSFAKMKKGVLLVNAARGGLIDEDALLRAIDAGIVRGAALDVFETEPARKDHPLFGRDEIIATPHLGASTFEAQVNVAVEAAEQMIAFAINGTKMNAF